MLMRIKIFPPDQIMLVLFLSAVASITTQLLLTLPAWAVCSYEGKSYQTGETVGPYICMPDGTWKQR